MSDTTPSSIRHQKRGLAYMWLAYTGFLFIQPIFDPSLKLWLATLVSFAIFLGIFAFYVRTTDADTNARLAVIAATFFLGLLTFPWNPGASTYFIYAAAFLPFTVRSTARVLGFFAFESLAIVAEHFAFHTHGSLFYVSWPDALFAIFLLVIIGGGNIFFAEQKRADCKLRMAHNEIEAIAAVAERERIARDLHDVLGHTLSLITLKAELAGRLIQTNPTRAVAEIAEVERTARTALAEVREAIGGYRSRGLAAEVETARRTLDAAGVTLLFDTNDEPIDNNRPSSPQHSPSEPWALGPGPSADAGAPHLDSEMWAPTTLTAAEETILALALREAVTNIVRHAQAKTCRLRFLTEDGHRRLLVEDDGHHPLTREGNGLRGMRERVESIGGHLSLERKNGTRLLIELPLRTEAAA
jgi:two-component system sensor histidine kinase DesK